MQNFPWIKSYPQGVRWDDALNLTSVQTLLDNAIIPPSTSWARN